MMIYKKTNLEKEDSYNSIYFIKPGQVNLLYYNNLNSSLSLFFHHSINKSHRLNLQGVSSPNPYSQVGPAAADYLAVTEVPEYLQV